MCRLLANLYSGNVYVWSTADQVRHSSCASCLRFALTCTAHDAVSSMSAMGHAALQLVKLRCCLQSLVKSFEVTELPGELRINHMTSSFILSFSNE